MPWQIALVENHVNHVLGALADRLSALGVVDALWVAGSRATGDYVEGVSDLDLVAVSSRPLTRSVLARVVRVHEEIDTGLARGMDLGCQYVDAERLLEVAAAHPTWTHGALVSRILSPVTRAELALHGFAVAGPSPGDLLPPVGPDDVRAAARAELAGYWSYAARRPYLFVSLPPMVDLGLTAMARGRHALAEGVLLPKTAAIELVDAPPWLKDDLRARRRGESVASPRLRAAHVAWRDVRRTTASVGWAGAR